MPGRQSTGPPSLGKPKPKKQKAKRSLNALAIAEKEVPSRPKIRKNRLGESEPRNSSKRKRRDEDERESSGEETGKRPRRSQKDRNGNDIEVGSDSSGNEWMVGQVDDDNDSDLDSDEAMGESDEERFEGYTFRRSSSQKSLGDRLKRRLGVDDEEPEFQDFDLEEGVAEEATGDNTSDDFGEEGVDLATMLDNDNKGNATLPKVKTSKKMDQESSASGSESDVSDESSASEKISDLSISEDEEDFADASKLASLQNLVSTMNNHDSVSTQARVPDAQETMTPSEYGINFKRKLTVADLVPSVTDPQLKKSLRLLAGNDSKVSNKRGGIPKKLEAPLPKRQQDRIDRVAAYEKSKETLSRWIDTVKHNRRAEHLSFPLQDPNAVVPQGQDRLLPNTQSKPLTDLEATIQSILHDSGLAPQNGKSEEDQIQAFEELKTNKMPIEEVLARRAELRAQRELLFREEIRAKRIKKIKSKTFRKVHRKERERRTAHLKDALAANGEDDSESEKERNDRRRAEERMGARHRESRWARGVKESGKAKWDDDAREGVNEMARRGEELRRRIEGKDVRGEENSDDSSDDGGADDDLGEDINGQERRLQDQLQGIQAGESQTDHYKDAGGSRLSTMAFMKKVEASRKAGNDADAERLRRDIADDDTPSEHEGAEGPGRQVYGPQKKMSEILRSKQAAKRSEFEEREGSDAEDQNLKLNHDVDMDRIAIDPGLGIVAKEPRPFNHETSLADGSWNMPNGKESCSFERAIRRTSEPVKSTENGDRGKPRSALKGARAAENAQKDYSTVESKLPQLEDQNSSDENETAQNEPIIFRNAELAKLAFAGDDVVDKFLEEKEKLIHDQEDQIIDNTLPGWGTWTGEGIGKKASKPRPRHCNVTKVSGIAPENRKDAKLKDVIISEKRVKKNGKYLAGQLPHPFETRAQYERSLRLPVGPEWTTKETYQSMTKPRVLIKQGIITPMVRPMV